MEAQGRQKALSADLQAVRLAALMSPGRNCHTKGLQRKTVLWGRSTDKSMSSVERRSCCQGQREDTCFPSDVNMAGLLAWPAGHCAQVSLRRSLWAHGSPSAV